MPSPRRARGASIDQPYPGLRPFDLKDAFLFFGRESHIQSLLERLSRNRFLAVVGTSGSGKSSLVRAGLMPALYRGYLVGATSRWRIAIMRPGGGPIDELASALAAKDALNTDPAQLRAMLAASSHGFVSAVKNAQFGAGESLLLVVDQFEEIFRFASERRSIDSAGEALLFVTSLLEAVDQFDAPIYVVLTMRTDFLGDCTLFTGLPEALNRGQYLIPRMSREQRRDAIETPDEIVAAEIAPRLIQQVLNDVGDDPDQLPVMQHALARMYRLWKLQATGAPLDLDDYEKAGTIGGALDHHAQSIYDGFSPQDREWTRKIFRCLTKMEKGREVRRPARLDRLLRVVGASDPVSRDAVLRVIEVFSSEEHSLLLLTPGSQPEDRIVDISHESLIRKWRLLSAWVKEEGESAEWFSDLVRDTARQARGEADYWVNPELSWVLARKLRDGWNAAWAEQNCGSAQSFADVERFLEGSRTKERKRQRLQYLLWAGAAVMLALGMIAIVEFSHAKKAKAELATLSLQQRTDRDKLAALQQDFQHAKTEGERDRIRASIYSVQNDFVKSLQQENQELKSKVSGMSPQPKPIDVDSLNRRISELTPKAQEYDTLKPQYDDMVKQASSLIESLKKERDVYKRERDGYYQQLVSRSTEGSGKPASATAAAGATGSTASPNPAGSASPAGPAASERPPAVLPPGRTQAVNPPSDSPATEPTAPITVTLNNDSAVVVAKTGLMLLVKHMGALAASGNMYVLTGTPAPDAVIHPYTKDLAASERYVKIFEASPVLKACKGGFANVNGYTIWCFKIEDIHINKDKHRTQHLGVVTAEGRRFDFFGTDFVYRPAGATTAEVEIRAVK